MESACGAIRGFGGLGLAEVGGSKSVVGLVVELETLPGGSPLNYRSSKM